MSFNDSLDLRAYTAGEWVVLRDMHYTSEAGRVVTVPCGFITDLASIPTILLPIYPTTDATRQPAVMHDWLYCSKETTRAEADGLFLEAMKSCGISWLHRYSMYWGVRSFGWRYFGKRDGLTGDDFAGRSTSITPNLRQK